MQKPPVPLLRHRGLFALHPYEKTRKIWFDCMCILKQTVRIAMDLELPIFTAAKLKHAAHRSRWTLKHCSFGRDDLQN